MIITTLMYTVNVSTQIVRNNCEIASGLGGFAAPGGAAGRLGARRAAGGGRRAAGGFELGLGRNSTLVWETVPGVRDMPRCPGLTPSRGTNQNPQARTA